MKKIYLTFLSLCFLSITFVHGQRRVISSTEATKISKKNFSSGYKYRTTAVCDTINVPLPDAWNLNLYGVSQNGGYLTGANRYNDKEKAAFFDVSTTGETFLTRVLIYFGKANTNIPGNLSKVIPIHVYNGTIDDGPTTLITTVNKTFAEIKADVDLDNLTEIVFPTAVSIPASGKFFISVDISNLVWNNTTAAAAKDSFAVVSTSAGDELPDDNGYFFEKYSDDTWVGSFDSYEIDLALAIFPFVGTSASCGSTLPITLSTFTGERQGAKNLLKWTTQSEQNNKGFELQRSADGTNFTSLGFTNTRAANGHSNSKLAYAFEDTKPFNGTSYYRLKQVDNNGKYTLSSVVLIKGVKSGKLELSLLYPNPTKSLLNMVVSAPANDKISLMVTDMTGRVVMQEARQMMNGDNNIQLNVGKLPSGSYMIKAVCATGCETGVRKFVKQ